MTGAAPPCSRAQVAPGGSCDRNIHPTLPDPIKVKKAMRGSLTTFVVTSLDVHILGATATSGNAKVDAAFEALAGQDIDSDSFAAVQTVTAAMNATSGVETIATITFTQAQADGILAGGAFRLRLTCDAVDAAHTMTGDMQVSNILGRQ